MAPTHVVLTAAPDASGHYRARQPAEALKNDPNLRISVAHGGLPLEFSARTGQFVKCALRPDVLVLQRPMAWFMPDVIRYFQTKGVPVIIELDDDFHTADPGNRAFAVNHPKTSPDSNWLHLSKCIREADWVTVSTDALKERYGSHGRVSVIRNSVDDDWLQIRPKTIPRTVGWAGTTLNHSNDLPATRGGVAWALEERPDWSFLNIGGQANIEHIAQQLEFPASMTARISSTPYKALELHPYLVSQIDVGIVPLSPTKFNEAKCLDTTTLVMTDSGIRQIGQISEADRVWRGDRWVQVEAVSHQPEVQGLRIETELGYQLTLTANHRLLADGEWIQAGHMRPGMQLVLEREQWPQNVPYVSVPWPAQSRRTRGGGDPDFTQAESGPRIAIDERWGRLLGMFAGDGSASGKTAISFACDGQDQDLIDLIFDDLRQIGLVPTTEKVTTYGGQLLRRRSIRVASGTLTRTLAAMGLLNTPDAHKTRKRVIKVPDEIWTSPRSVVSAFLAGLFEADGHTRSSGIGFVSKDESLARDVQRLLAGFGIVSRVHAKSHRAQNGFRGMYWHVDLRRASADVFAREIGFLSSRKRDRLTTIVSKPHSNAYRSMAEVDEIKSITPSVVMPVDLQVKGQAFSAAGILSHNSYLKGIEYAALGIPFVASSTEEYKLLSMQGIGVVVPDKAKLWKQWLTRLMDHRDVYANELRTIIRERHTASVNAWRFAEVWQDVADTGVTADRLRNAQRQIRRTRTTTQGVPA